MSIRNRIDKLEAEQAGGNKRHLIVFAREGSNMASGRSAGIYDDSVVFRGDEPGDGLIATATRRLGNEHSIAVIEGMDYVPPPELDALNGD